MLRNTFIYLPLAYLINTIYPLFLLLSAGGTATKIEKLDNHLNGIQAAFLILLCVLKSLGMRLGLVRGAQMGNVSTSDEGHSSKDGIEPSSKGGSTGETFNIIGPEVKLSMPFSITPKDITAYNTCIQSSQSTTTISNPLHLSLFLAALTQSTMLLLLSSLSCPINPLGAVAVRNTFKTLDAEACGRLGREGTKDGREGKRAYSTEARLERTAKKVKRGWEFEVVVELRSSVLGGRPAVGSEKCQTDGNNDNLDWKTIFTQTFTFLQFHKHSTPPSVTTQPVTSTPDIPAQWGPGTLFSISSSSPTKWAHFSNDYNPIHLSSIVARYVFGLKGKIAHGNYVAARGVQAVLEGDEGFVGEELRGLEVGDDGVVELRFRRMVVVPAELEIKRIPLGDGKEEEEDDDMIALDVFDRGKVCVEIRYTP